MNNHLETNAAMAQARVSTPEAAQRNRRPRRLGDGLWVVAIMALPVLGLIVFYLWPLVRTIILSFSDGSPFIGYHLSGFESWSKVLHDPTLFTSLRNTLVYAVIVLLGVPIAMLIAVLLHQKGLRFRGFYRVLYFLPVVTMPAAVAMVWRYIYNGDFGLLNTFLGWFGIEGRAWVADPHTALVAVAIVGIWTSLGTNLVILAAGLEAIPAEVLEAARLDGAGSGKLFTKVIAPLMSPSVFLLSILSVIGSLQVFDLIFVMLGRTNPALGNTRSIVYFFYEEAFVRSDRPAGAVIALITLIVTGILTLIQFRLQKRWVHYA